MFYKMYIPFSDFVVYLATFGNRNIFDKMQFQEAIVMDIRISIYYIPIQGRKCLPKTGGASKGGFFQCDLFFKSPNLQKNIPKNYPELEI